MSITADDLIAVLEKALDADAQLSTPESAGFATDAIRDFLAFVQAHGGFEVPTGPTGNEPVHFGSLMGGLVIGAVAAGRSSKEQRYREALERVCDEGDRICGRFPTDQPLGGFADDVRNIARAALKEETP